MRIILSLLLLLFASTTAYAQTPQIERAEVVEHGIYAADAQSCNRNKQGILNCVVGNIRLAATTTTIPAQHGVRFGIRFRLSGAPNGATVALKRVWILPPPGLRSPNVNQPIRRLEDAYSAVIGETKFTEYTFDDPWELVPGTWTIEMWYGNRKLLSQSFMVVKS